MKFTTPNKSLRRITTVLALLFLFQGCKTTYEMQVDAISNPDPQIGDAESYVIVPRDPNTDTRDLRYQETVTWIKTALSAKGLYEATNPKEADMVVEIDYGMEPPRQEIRTRTEPVYVMQRGRGRYETVVTVNPKTGVATSRRIFVPGRISKQLVGYEEIAYPVTVVEKYLVLSAKENKLTESGDVAPEELWSVTITNNDDSSNLREYLPVLASAATDYIGEDTESGETIRIKEDDEVVAFIKKGLAKETL